MVNAIEALGFSTYDAVLIKAMLLVSFHAFLRPGEMTKSVNSLKVRNTKVKSSSFKIKMTSFKHSNGRQATIKSRLQEEGFAQ